MSAPQWIVPLSETTLGEEEALAAADVVRSGWLTQGARVQAFEKAFAAFIGVPHAIAVANCTVGLEIAFDAVGVKPGDEVIAPALTFVATANAARRLGAEEVHILYRRSEKEMPAFPFEYEHAKLEGVRFVWRVAPVAILPAADDAGRVGGLRLIRMELGEPDASGRRRPEPAEGTEFNFACDMVMRAVGQSRLMASLEAERAIGLHDGCIAVDRATGQTSNARYFAGGDCVNGGREVVDAVADGKRAARAIMARLEGR